MVREREAEELRLAEGGFSLFFLAAAGAFLQVVVLKLEDGHRLLRVRSASRSSLSYSRSGVERDDEAD